ncbi:hypothetical protein [Mycoplasmopsis mustelae]|uniref:hypothetical protein n=1 Tax=Mycoplasmopsis mustelae TaxID=171289 RepID=UPI0010668EA6|nr:hypothetical protein [Mycoplasmopsis mustelae]
MSKSLNIQKLHTKCKFDRSYIVGDITNSWSNLQYLTLLAKCFIIFKFLEIQKNIYLYDFEKFKFIWSEGLFVNGFC